MGIGSTRNDGLRKRSAGRSIVIPAKAGISRRFNEIPAFAGMTAGYPADLIYAFLTMIHP